VFADRGYEEDGSLTHRSKEGALLTDEEEVVERVIRMVNHGVVRTTSGKEIPIDAETICIHSDGKNALKLAKILYQAIHNRGNYIIEQGQSK
ncbi:MAG TPA: LamB/YcsF family protein, partial [Chitinophagaceae bacterium]